MTPARPPRSPVDPFVRRFLKGAAPLFADASGVVVAVSGGADSLALMHLMAASRLLAPSRLFVAHFDHHLRPESRQEAEFTREAALSLELPCVIETWSGPPETGNLPAAARNARYAFLHRVARERDCSHLAVAHHGDDQAETVLERLLMGSGPRGLAAMSPLRPLPDGVTLARPLLDFRHAELMAWLAARGIRWLEDPSNADVSRMRARLRHRVLPLLGEALSGGDPVPMLAGTARRMAATREALTWSLERVWPQLDCRREGASLSLSWLALRGLPEELARLALLRCHAELAPGRPPPGERATSQFARLMGGTHRHWSMVMQGMELFRRLDRLVLQPGRGPQGGRPGRRMKKPLGNG